MSKIRSVLASLFAATLTLGLVACVEPDERSDSHTSYIVVVDQPGASQTSVQIPLPPAVPPGTVDTPDAVQPQPGAEMPDSDVGTAELRIGDFHPIAGDRAYPLPDPGNIAYPQPDADSDDSGLEPIDEQKFPAEPLVIAPPAADDDGVLPQPPLGDSGVVQPGAEPVFLEPIDTQEFPAEPLVIAPPAADDDDGVLPQPPLGDSGVVQPGAEPVFLEPIDEQKFPAEPLVIAPPAADDDGVLPQPPLGDSGVVQPGAEPLPKALRGYQVESVATDGRFVFVTTVDEPAVRGVDTATGAVITISVDDPASIPYSIAIADGYLYWTDLGTGAVVKADLASFTLQLVAVGQPGPADLAVADGVVRWHNLDDGSAGSAR